MEIRQTVREFIERRLALDHEQTRIEADEPLLNGLLDSLAILRLAVFIEEQFAVRVEDEDLVPENFQTIEQIASYIQRKSMAVA
jgi:acyl carrier protein